MPAERIPQRPTIGWLYSACEARGLSVRGTDITAKAMAAWLKKHHGIEVIPPGSSAGSGYGGSR